MATCERTKAALIRREGYPVGQPAPCFFRCCENEIDAPAAGDYSACPDCGKVFDSRGYVTRIRIVSNGSKWHGQAPDSIATLIEVLKTETLDPTFENYGNFITYPTIEHDNLVRLFGNFQTVSHVFQIYGTEAELRGVIEAIRANQARDDYKAARKALGLGNKKGGA